MKAKLFLSFATEDERSFDERALWASLALELLAKAALTRVNPTLIAHPSDDGVNMLIASGVLPGDARFTSLPPKSLYSRCARAFKPFSDTQGNKITQARNDYLRGGTPGFTSIPEAAWWPRFWSQAAILVNAMDKQIGDLVGSANGLAVERHLEQNTKNIEHRTEMLIERAKQRILLRDSGNMSAKVEAELSRRVTSALVFRTALKSHARRAERLANSRANMFSRVRFTPRGTRRKTTTNGWISRSVLIISVARTASWSWTATN
jgi:hypothetical protein